MSDEPSLGQVLATIQGVASTTASMRVELIGRIDGLAGKLDQLAGRMDGFFTELGKTRSELMDRMQTVRTDVSMNLGAANVAQQSERAALEQGFVLAEAVAALTRQVRQLQDRVDALEDRRPAA